MPTDDEGNYNSNVNGISVDDALREEALRAAGIEVAKPKKKLQPQPIKKPIPAPKPQIQPIPQPKPVEDVEEPIDAPADEEEFYQQMQEEQERPHPLSPQQQQEPQVQYVERKVVVSVEEMLNAIYQKQEMLEERLNILAFQSQELIKILGGGK